MVVGLFDPHSTFAGRHAWILLPKRLQPFFELGKRKNHVVIFVVAVSVNLKVRKAARL